MPILLFKITATTLANSLIMSLMPLWTSRIVKNTLFNFSSFLSNKVLLRVLQEISNARSGPGLKNPWFCRLAQTRKPIAMTVFDEVNKI